MSIFTRIIIVLFSNYASTFFSIFMPLLVLTIAILSRQLYWWIHFILFSPIYINIIMTIASAGCICYIYFPYYKFRFDQLNKEIISNIPNGKWQIIFPSKEKWFLELINKHNSLSLEIHRFNLQFRRSAAMIWICFAFIKITTLYLTIYLKHTLTRILALNAFIIFFFFGFALTNIFSLQINSAKNSYKIIHSIACKYKMRFGLRLKVNDDVGSS